MIYYLLTPIEEIYSLEKKDLNKYSKATSVCESIRVKI